MKHIKPINEWFGSKPKEGDDFIKRIIEIIKSENIKIEIQRGFKFIIDNNEYHVDGDESFLEGIPCTISVNKKNLSISRKYYKEIQNLWFEQEQKEKFENLPDISDIGRTAKKYNL